MSQPSRFFSFEGIDGSGKSTQARLLASALRDLGYSVVLVREPGSTPLGDDVRRILLTPGLGVSDKAEVCLFAAARAQLVSQVIEPALRDGCVVVVDRYIDSSIAYQGAGRSAAPTRWITTLNEFATGGLSPRRTYLIDVAPETASERRGSTTLDRIEESGDDFYHRVRTEYLALAVSDPVRVMKLDGARSIDDIHQAILADVLGTLGMKRASDADHL